MQRSRNKRRHIGRHAVSWFLAATVILTSFVALARIKLTTLPKRERVEIQLDNGKYTLVDEVRIIPLLASTARGHNKIDFSWTNTHVHKGSILFRPIAIRDGKTFRPIRKVTLKSGQKVPEVNVLNVSYPPGENALVWEVYAHKASAVKVRVSYLISNLNRWFSYRARANKDETELQLKQFINIKNLSGEDFGLSHYWFGFGKHVFKNIEHRSTIKILSHAFPKVPIEKTFTFDWYRHGRLNAAQPHASKILMHYVLKNNKDQGLGLFPLRRGKVRIFINDGHGGEAFLGEDRAKFTPIDGQMKLFLGESRDIVCKRIVEHSKRHRVRGNLYNQELVVRYEIQNFKDKAATLTVVEQIKRLASQYFRHSSRFVEWETRKKTSKGMQIKGMGTQHPKLVVTLPARPKGKGKVKTHIIRFHVMLKNLW